MLPVLALAVHEPGRPAVSEVDWRPAFAHTVDEIDDLGGTRAVTRFVPVLEAEVAPAVATHAALRLADAREWERGRELLAERGATLGDGHLAELWMLAIPSSDALAASKRPAWVSRDEAALLVPFPALATQWLARLPKDSLRMEAGRLADLSAWLAEDADAELLEVAYELLALVRPLAVLAERRGGVLSAHLRRA